MEAIITRLSKNYGISEEDVKQNLSPEYDIEQNCNHKQVTINICGEEIEVDEKLSDLITLINSDNFYTIMSCQHDRFGWSSITFSIEGFLKFSNKLLKKAKQKYNNDIDKIYSLNIIQRFQFTTFNGTSNVDCSNYIYDGDDEFRFSVNIRFKQSEISMFEEELKELFENN